ncbi:hypothetical protein JMG10_14675 [Nostoc ellipsosporum NOK]|nr:hypothetical protein [Nostoc ellipsosporum NOK]
MKHLFFLTLLSLVCLPVLLPVQNKFIDTDTLVNGLANSFMKEKEAVGPSTGIYQNGNGRFYNFGTTHKGKSLMPTLNSLYKTGLVTRTFVALVLANAVVKKRASLSDDIKETFGFKTRHSNA